MSQTGTVTVYMHQAFYLHDPAPVDHPEAPRRLDLARRALDRLGLRPRLLECSGDPWKEYSGVHDQEYLTRLRRLVDNAEANGSTLWLDPDTYVSPGTRESLEALACSTRILAEQALEGGNSILLLRPPGHHAGRSGAALGAPTQGFCLLNTAALLAALLGSKGRILVLDIDAHHGNGTQEILASAGVPHVDIHQDPRTIYPGTGLPWEAGPAGSWFNIIVPPGSGDDILFDAFGIAREIVESHDPDFIVVSLGFDAYEGDNHFASVRASHAYYLLVASTLAGMGRPVAAVLEGGYGKGLVYGLESFIRGLGSGLARPKPVTFSEERVWEWYRRSMRRAHWFPAHA